ALPECLYGRQDDVPATRLPHPARLPHRERRRPASPRPDGRPYRRKCAGTNVEARSRSVSLPDGAPSLAAPLPHADTRPASGIAALFRLLVGAGTLAWRSRVPSIESDQVDSNRPQGERWAGTTAPMTCRHAEGCHGTRPALLRGRCRAALSPGGR